MKIDLIKPIPENEARGSSPNSRRRIPVNEIISQIMQEIQEAKSKDGPISYDQENQEEIGILSSIEYLLADSTKNTPEIL